MRGRAQTHDLRAELDRAVIAVVGNVGQGDVKGHGNLLSGFEKTTAGAVQQTQLTCSGCAGCPA